MGIYIISLSSYQKKKKLGTASKPKVQKDPCLASLDRMDLEVVLSNCSLAYLGFELVEQAVVVVVVVVAQDQIQQDLDHRPYRLRHRTLVLYSRNQSRTNIALCKERKGGGGSACRVAQCDSGMGRTGSTRQLQECLPCSPSRCFLVPSAPAGRSFLPSLPSD